MNDVFLYVNGNAEVVTDKGDTVKNIKHWVVVYGEYLESQKIDPLKCRILLAGISREGRFIRKGKKLEISFTEKEK